METLKKIRLGLVYLVVYLLSPLRKVFYSKPKSGVTIIGTHYESGLGQVVKILYQSINKKFQRQLVYLYEKKEKKYRQIQKNDINIIVGNPDLLMPSIRYIFGFSIFKKYNIGFWFWELDQLPYRWFLSRHLVDEIWVQSDFVFNAFKKLTKNVIKIPFYIETSYVKDFSRAYLKIPENKFIFLFTFDFLSSYERKNPEAVVKSFVEAFGTQDDVYLIIKTVNANKDFDKKKRFEHYVKGLTNVEFRDIFLTKDEHLGLIKSSDCYVSLHRSEGLGLAMAEAMSFGKPVIGTNYSGNLEFMNAENSFLVDFKLVSLSFEQYYYGRNQDWAEPNISHAASLMRKVKSDNHLRLITSKKAAKDIRDRFSKERYQQFLFDRFEGLLNDGDRGSDSRP